MTLRFFSIEGSDRWDGAVEQCQLAEDVGFEACWVNDHQATEGNNYWPSPLVRLTSIAKSTETLELVTSMHILPYHPLHVAQAAMVDNISNGWLTLGVGLGYVEEEFEAFGVPMTERAGQVIGGRQFLDEFLTSEGPISFSCPFFEIDDSVTSLARSSSPAFDRERSIPARTATIATETTSDRRPKTNRPFSIGERMSVRSVCYRLRTPEFPFDLEISDTRVCSLRISQYPEVRRLLLRFYACP